MIDFFVRVAQLVLIGLSLIAFFIAMDVFFEKRLDRTRQVIAAQPGRSFLIGLVNILFFGSIALGFLILGSGVNQIFSIPAMIVLIPLCIVTVLGVGGLVGLAGERLFPGSSRNQRTILATALIYIACLAPIVGWFALTSYLAVTGVGGFLLSFLKREEEAVVSDQ